MRYNVKATYRHDNGDYFIRINNKDLPYIDEDVVLSIRERNKEIERLHSIIKEVREYTEEMQVWDYEFNEFVVQTKELLEILDKDSDKE